ncbi:hypothetical protein LCGC14_1707600 [marine sediment metagenome]|uniref:Uncharacterized protein n=1 Tax=marine sediment metagenome TaxID=412755 RepID=A0A0F9JWK0_9ZZZZ
MKKLERLRKEALASCESRGHKMQQFSRKYRHWWSSACRTCSKMVLLNDNPLPNEIEIGGEAVALGCDD